MLNNKYLKYIVIAIGIIVAIVSFFLLPEKVGMQIGLDGKLTNYLDKPIAILVPLALVAVGDIAFVVQKKPRYLVASAVGIVVGILSIILN